MKDKYERHQHWWRAGRERKGQWVIHEWQWMLLAWRAHKAAGIWNWIGFTCYLVVVFLVGVVMTSFSWTILWLISLFVCVAFVPTSGSFLSKSEQDRIKYWGADWRTWKNCDTLHLEWQFRSTRYLLALTWLQLRIFSPEIEGLINRYVPV